MSQVAAIGFYRSRDAGMNMSRFKAVLKGIEQFVEDNPDVLVGDNDEFAVVCGPRACITVTKAKEPV